MQLHLEICIDSLESARNAIKGGATRLEACAALSEGGLTPSPGLVRAIKARDSKIPIYAMIRIRSGDFVYTREEMDAMIYDLGILKGLGADGFVFGALTEGGEVNADYCREIVSAAHPRKVTFHRAFDETREPFEALSALEKLGFERILTSGRENTAAKGMSLLAKLVDEARDRISIMPGGGINHENIWDIRMKTNAREFHSSARIVKEKANKVKIGDNADAHIAIASDDFVEKMIHNLNYGDKIHDTLWHASRNDLP